MRKLVDGTEAVELEQSIVLEIKTKCPSKYLLLDLETNETYRGSNNSRSGEHWSKVEDSFINQYRNLDPTPAATAVNVREILDAVDELLKL